MRFSNQKLLRLHKARAGYLPLPIEKDSSPVSCVVKKRTADTYLHPSASVGVGQQGRGIPEGPFERSQQHIGS